MIESDALADAPPDGQRCITLPIKQLNQQSQNYQYVGKNTEFTASWSETTPPDHFKKLTGHELTAVSSGDITFAAFYPNCRNIFGFYDAIQDVTVPAESTVQVMYQVTGWFSNPANDPLQGGLSQQDILEKYHWTFAGETATKPRYTLCSGLVQNIAWSPNNTYIVDQPQQKPIRATVAIGNTPAEAFAAFFKDKLHPEVPFFEQLLAAFQTGLLNTFQQPAPDQLAQLEASLHQQAFGANKAGTIYTIVQKTSQGKEQAIQNLPLQLAEALNQLNSCQQQFDAYQAYMAHFQGQLFSDWYRLMQADDDTTKNDLYALLYNQVGQTWPTIQAKMKTLQADLNDQKDSVAHMIANLETDASLQATAAPRYWHPHEPVVVLTSQEENALAPYRTTTTLTQNLVCRLTNALPSQVTIQGQVIKASQFAGIKLPQPNHLPFASPTHALLVESCLLNTQLLAALTNLPAADLVKDLQKALADPAQTTFTFDGQMPAAIAVAWSATNPWAPLLMEWTAHFYPLCSTTDEAGAMIDYPTNYFTAQYSIDQTTGGTIQYRGDVDPSTIDFFGTTSQLYRGNAVLATSAAEGFKKQLQAYLANHQDKTLQSIWDTLNQQTFQSQALSGFNTSLLMQAQTLQLRVATAAKNPYAALTPAVRQAVGTYNTVAPAPNSYYNPIRAGFMQLSFKLVDRYGQKRTVSLDKRICAASLTTTFHGTKEPNIIYLPPSIAQPSRLVFRWLAAVGEAFQEMNAHPATTPVCGWILPNQLTESLFFYDQQGKALGTMFLNGDQSAIEWKSAPGNDTTINQSVEAIFQYQNPQLRALAMALYNGTPNYFKAFWRAIDKMQHSVNPQNFAASSNLALLIGRPIAITQACIGLELQGSPAHNQSYKSIQEEKYAYDNKFTQVQFPVILGDLHQVNDGLIGYFKTDEQGYDWTTFYSEAAEGTDAGVIKPPATNLMLTAFPKADAPAPTDNTAYLQKTLMLVDPRAKIHATTGILPTKAIEIPSDQYAAILKTLEMTFLMTPLLKGASGLTMPLPKEAGYTWSWIAETAKEQKTAWQVDPVITPAVGQAIAGYTPQTIREGWLRLNPDLLNFELLNQSGQPVAKPHAPNTLVLNMTNKKGNPITMPPGQLTHARSTPTGAIFYIHFGRLIPDEEIPNITMQAANWAFKCLSDPQYGNYWTATPTQSVTLANDKSIAFTLSNLITADRGGQVQLFIDYYGFQGLNDGTQAILITLNATN